MLNEFFRLSLERLATAGNFNCYRMFFKRACINCRLSLIYWCKNKGRYAIQRIPALFYSIKIIRDFIICASLTDKRAIASFNNAKLVFSFSLYKSSVNETPSFSHNKK